MRNLESLLLPFIILAVLAAMLITFDPVSGLKKTVDRTASKIVRLGD